MKVSLILACAGKGERAGYNHNKIFEKINGKTILETTLSVFIGSGLIDEYILSVSEVDFNSVKSLVPSECKIVLGGKTRTQSVKNALSNTTGDIVLIHDCVRPFVTYEIIKECINSVEKYGSGITAVPSRDTVCTGDDDIIYEYLGKNGLYSLQTPQGFYTKDIISAYNQAGENSFNDDGEVYKEYISTPKLSLGSVKNIKLTYPEDFEKLNRVDDFRYGTGFDCHKLVENRKLILGGVEITHDKGLLGHSDADVLTHAIMDAILSAGALRDIGYYFPDTDPKYKGANSIELLKQVIALISEKGLKVKSVSATIMAEKPKLLKIIPDIKKSLAEVLQIPVSDLGLGATTLEGLGFVGREEGICVSSTAVLISK